MFINNVAIEQHLCWESTTIELFSKHVLFLNFDCLVYLNRISMAFTVAFTGWLNYAPNCQIPQQATKQTDAGYESSLYFRMCSAPQTRQTKQIQMTSNKAKSKTNPVQAWFSTLNVWLDWSWSWTWDKQRFQLGVICQNLINFCLIIN